MNLVDALEVLATGYYRGYTPHEIASIVPPIYGTNSINGDLLDGEITPETAAALHLLIAAVAHDLDEAAEELACARRY
jgi:hypothetical protein